MTHLRAIVLAAAAAVLACSRGPSPAPGPAGGTGPAGAPTAGIGAPEQATVAHVNTISSLRREPTDAPRVKGPTGKEIGNVLASLQRGEKVTLLEAREDWSRVRSSDDREGWMKRATLLEGDAVSEATVLVAADVFDRPDLLAANAKRKIEPGTLVLVVKAKPPFSEVNVAGAQTAWVLTDRLATGDREVSVAKLAEKARWLLRAGRADEAAQVVALARTHFADVPLVEVIAAEVGLAPADPAGGETVPPAAPVPAAVPSNGG